MDCAGILGCEKQRLFQKIPFTVGGRSFVSMEQYILYCKCLLAGNCGVAKKIMSMKDPAEISESGKEEIPGHRAEVWENALTDVLDSACRAVTEQNTWLKFSLLIHSEEPVAFIYTPDWGYQSVPPPTETHKSQRRNLLNSAYAKVRGILKENEEMEDMITAWEKYKISKKEEWSPPTAKR